MSFSMQPHKSNRPLPRPTTGLWVGLLLPLTACGGASEQRVKTLEEQVTKLQQMTEGDDGAAIQERLGAIESGTIESLKKMEEKLQVMQQQVAAKAAAPESDGAAPAAAAAPAPAPSGPDTGLWAAVDAALGVEGEPVQANENTFTISRAWLRQEVEKLAIAGKGPKLSAGKKGGVSIKGVRPKTLADKLGLKNNDSILAVNGANVASVAEIATALRESSDTTTVKIMRRKEEQVLTYKLVD